MELHEKVEINRGAITDVGKVTSLFPAGDVHEHVRSNHHINNRLLFAFGKSAHGRLNKPTRHAESFLASGLPDRVFEVRRTTKRRNREVRGHVKSGAAAGMKIGTSLIYGVKGRMGRAGAARRGRPGQKPKDGKMTASDFIRSQPREMSAKDVVEAAVKAGIKNFGTPLVYIVRSKMKTSGPKVAGRGRRTSGTTQARSADVSAFKRMALEMGITNARRALDELERGLAALLG